MKIYQIQPINTSFKTNDYVSKKMLGIVKNGTKNAVQEIPNKTANLIAASISTVAVNEILKENGITYCDTSNNTVLAGAGYNGGYFTVKYDYELNPEVLKANFAQALLRDNNSALGGLLNYKAMISDLKRQDIIQKGLQLHTYEMNTKVSQDEKKSIAANFSKLSKKYVKPNNLFFIGTDAFYYDKTDKMAYCISMSENTYALLEPRLRICKFKTNDQGNLIGYTLDTRDLFQQRRIENEYMEQQQPSEKLPEIADDENNKLFAEAFRFGNTTIQSPRIQIAIPAVLEHLSERVKIKNPTKEQLQIVKFYNKDKNVITRICYYDSTTGRSLIYNNEGKYMYQLEYNKDAFGKIVACSRY